MTGNEQLGTGDTAHTDMKGTDENTLAWTAKEQTKKVTRICGRYHISSSYENNRCLMINSSFNRKFLAEAEKYTLGRIFAERNR